MTHKATLAVRTGIETDTQHGAVVPPIYLSSNYTFADFGEPRQYDYARSGNPKYVCKVLNIVPTGTLNISALALSMSRKR